MAQASETTKLPAWHRGVAALGIVMVYAQVALMLAGVDSKPAHGSLSTLAFVMHLGAVLAMVVTALGLMTGQDKRAVALGFLHMALLMLLLVCAWGFFPVALPATPEDFRDLIMPMVGLMVMTQALARGTGFPKW